MNTEKLDKAALLQTVSRGIHSQLRLGQAGGVLGSHSFNPAAAAGASTEASEFSRALSEGAGGLGTSAQPLHMTMAEPSFRTQLWRSIRTFLTLIDGVSELGAMLEDKNVGRSLGMNKEEAKPVMNSTTRFSDVQGMVGHHHVCVA